MPEPIHAKRCACQKCTPRGPAANSADADAAFALLCALLVLILPAAAVMAKLAGVSWGAV